MSPRIRSIKPDFFLHDELGDHPALTRLFFIGLFTQADREGRIEYRPKRLKAALLPYDDCDVDEMVQALSPEHLTLYEVDGKTYLEIVNFLRHQCPNVKEPASTIPAPCKDSSSTSRLGREGKGKERVENAREESEPLFVECHDALLSAFATVLPSAQTLKLRRLCSDYAGQTPSALDRIMFGIAKAKKEDKRNPAFAIGCASNAGADEVKPYAPAGPKVCEVCHGTKVVQYADGPQPCIFCPPDEEEPI